MTFTDHARVTHKDGGLKMRKRIVREFVPGTTTMLLSDPSKMPSLSWSLPAGKACPWALYGENAICGGCYAQKGRYIMSNVAKAQETRFAWARACLKSNSGTDQPKGRSDERFPTASGEEFVSTMTRAIRRAGNSYFRVHDSGDLFSPEYTMLWVRVCQAVPEVKFWFPTRSWRVLTLKNVPEESRKRWALALMELAGLPNVTMRPSALFFNAPAPRIDGMACGSTACDDGFTCPAYTQGNICGSCRACWDAPEQAISYHRH